MIPSKSLVSEIKRIQGNRSNRQFAKDAGISPAALTRIYKGEYTPSAATLYKISQLEFINLIQAAYETGF